MATQYKNSRQDMVLSNVSIDYIPEGYVCDLVLTPLPVAKWTGIIAGYGKSHLQLYNTRVFDRGAYHTVPTVSRTLTNNYNIENHGLKDFVTERDREEIELPFQARADVVRGLKNLLMTEKEYAVASIMTKTASYDSTTTSALGSTAKWSDYVNSDPLGNFKTAITAVWQKTKKVINTAIIPFDVLQTLRYHPKLTNVYGSTGKFEAISVDQLKRAIGIQNILVPSAAYETSAGAETAFWGKNVILYHRASSAGLHQRTYGYYLRKTGHESRVFTKEAPEMVNADMILHDMAYQYKIMNTGAGYLFQTVIA